MHESLVQSLRFHETANNNCEAAGCICAGMDYCSSHLAKSAAGYGSANVSTGVACNNSGGNATINVGWGRDNKCKGELGAYLVCSEWGNWDGEKYPLITAKLAVVDGKTIKPVTWYALKDGEFVEVDE